MREDTGGQAAPLRTLFVSASIGSGHHQAQLAVQQALQARGVAFEDHQGDAVTYLGPVERRLTVDLYAFELRYAPWLYKGFYQFTDLDHPVNFISSAFSWVGLPGMRVDLERSQPDVVVSSYWAPTALAGTVRRRTGQPFLNALIVTDYRVHRHWIRHEADLVMVASPETAEQMLERGLEPDRVVVTGIPIAPAFRRLMGADRRALRLQHGLDPDVPLILISGGGTGTFRGLGTVLAELSNLGQRVQVLVLAGADGHGVERVGGATIHHLGFTTDFPELLAASDLVVGKAGGLTVAEATTLGIPLVVHEPIPGQEEYNADLLVRHGAAMWARERRDVRGAVLRALDPDERARMGCAARRLGMPDAADRVVAALLQRLGRE
ncbi:MGDG synthase family glycosyltransferase [Deinococcus apachensis]|uniref:MGDG synthase family glycosyltransferase n=1 Tax=Deinococcus apachensis TaxID=309886 RepID=UPI00039D8066|nr:glycosyltransferase [Deinococcus apachensis]